MKIYLFTGKGDSKIEKGIILAAFPAMLTFACIGAFYAIAKEAFKVGEESVNK